MNTDKFLISILCCVVISSINCVNTIYGFLNSLYKLHSSEKLKSSSKQFKQVLHCLSLKVQLLIDVIYQFQLLACEARLFFLKRGNATRFFLY